MDLFAGVEIILIFYLLRSQAPAVLKKKRNSAMENNRNADGFISPCMIALLVRYI